MSRRPCACLRLFDVGHVGYLRRHFLELHHAARLAQHMMVYTVVRFFWRQNTDESRLQANIQRRRKINLQGEILCLLKVRQNILRRHSR